MVPKMVKRPHEDDNNDEGVDGYDDVRWRRRKGLITLLPRSDITKKRLVDSEWQLLWEWNLLSLNQKEWLIYLSAMALCSLFSGRCFCWVLTLAFPFHWDFVLCRQGRGFRHFPVFALVRVAVFGEKLCTGIGVSCNQSCIGSWDPLQRNAKIPHRFLCSRHSNSIKTRNGKPQNTMWATYWAAIVFAHVQLRW